MTIFLAVVSQLIKDELNGLSRTLKDQMESWLPYTKQLSYEQKLIVDTLSTSIEKFNDTGNDQKNSSQLIDLIGASTEKLRKIRETRGSSQKQGNTLTALTQLEVYIRGFLVKLIEFDKYEPLVKSGFQFINRRNALTPEGIFYLHVGSWLAREIFKPIAKIDLDIRAKKEVCLKNRIIVLEERIKPSHSLDERRDRAFQVLKDLANDNKDVVNNKGSYNIPLLTYGGVGMQVPKEWFFGEGRLGEELHRAVIEIEAMTPETYKPETDVAPAARHAAISSSSHATPPSAPPPSPDSSGDDVDHNSSEFDAGSDDDSRSLAPSM